MKLYTHCTRCNAQIAIKSTFVETRLDLAKRDGAQFELRCTACGERMNIHVDDVVATQSKRPIIITSFILILFAASLTFWLWEYGLFAFASFGIPIITIAKTRKMQQYKEQAFNELYSYFDTV